MRQRASGSGHQAAGIRQRAGSGRRRQRPHHQRAELGGCTVATVADGGIANGHPEGPMTGRKIAKSPRDPLRQTRQLRSPETVFLILSHLFTVTGRFNEDLLSGMLPIWIVAPAYLHARLPLAASGCHPPTIRARDLKTIASQTARGAALSFVRE